MKLRAIFAATLLAFGGAGGAGCTPSGTASDGGPGTGATSAMGGQNGEGGASPGGAAGRATASGGASGLGGGVSSGGTSGPGGGVSSGGTSGPGGSMSSGGASGQGGVAGRGGATGSGGSAGNGGGNGGRAGASGGGTGGGGRAGSTGTGGSVGNGGGTGSGGTGGAPTNACNGAASGAYYLDSAAGNDATTARSPDTAWKTLAKANSVTFQPGNSLCLKAGGSWTGQLAPKGSGTSAAPIVIDEYGSGAKPLLAAGSATPTRSICSISSTGRLTTWRSPTRSRSRRRLPRHLRSTARTAGTLNHIYIRSCFVHDVTGEVNWIGGDTADNAPGITFQTGWDASKKTGGIVFDVQAGTGTAVKTKFNDVLVENNTVSGLLVRRHHLQAARRQRALGHAQLRDLVDLDAAHERRRPRELPQPAQHQLRLQRDLHDQRAERAHRAERHQRRRHQRHRALLHRRA